MLMYEDYFTRDITLFIVSLRESLIRSFWLLIFIVFVTIAFALIGHLLFHHCLCEYKSFLEAFFASYCVGIGEEIDFDKND